MATRTMKLRAWQKASAAAIGKPAWEILNGPSPGGVAAELGISRQAVHQAIRRGTLDALIVNDDRTGDLVLFMIPQSSLEAFKAKREQRRAG